jgi:hypothetical protein
MLIMSVFLSELVFLANPTLLRGALVGMISRVSSGLEDVATMPTAAVVHGVIRAGR